MRRLRLQRACPPPPPAHQIQRNQERPQRVDRREQALRQPPESRRVRPHHVQPEIDDSCDAHQSGHGVRPSVGRPRAQFDVRHRRCNDVCDTDGVEAVHRMAHGPEPVGQHGDAKDHPADRAYGNPATGLPPHPDGKRHEAHAAADGGNPGADACKRRCLQQLAGVLCKRVVARREYGGNAGPEQEPRKRDQTRAEKQSAAA